MSDTHWIPPEARRGPHRTREAHCGRMVLEQEYSAEPTCPDCRAKFEADARALQQLIDDPPDPAERVHITLTDPLRDYVPRGQRRKR